MRYRTLLQGAYASVFFVFLLWLFAGSARAQTVTQNSGTVPDSAPKIVFDYAEHDFGKVAPNAPLTHNFVFRNAGSATLLIEKVKAG